MKIPLSQPDITKSEIDAAVSVLGSGWLSLGPMLPEFERAVADYCGAAHAVAVNSGTSGLHLCVRGLGIGEGDEVITASFTFVASANAALYERARPVLVDIDPLTLNIDPGLAERAVTPRTRAIIPVHTFGRPAQIEDLTEIARRHRVFLIEDACEALGAEYRGRKAGTFGNAGVFAFYPNKQITTGEGGVIVTNDARLADQARRMRNQGRDPSAGWYEHTELGYNYRIPELSCAIGIEQIKRISGILDRRRAIAHRYNKHLAQNPDIIVPAPEGVDTTISWFVYVVRLSDAFSAEDRDWIACEMNRRGIGCRRYFAPVHLQPLYRRLFGYKEGDLPATEKVASRTLALPFFNRITDQQVAEVCATLEELVGRRKSAGA